ncbi:MAG: hypothetical protein FJY85_02165 [Deltaproteobacteria bacterium]|nr:hypothetical protein [Deltaproteobacteria bacterium]
MSGRILIQVALALSVALLIGWAGEPDRSNGARLTPKGAAQRQPEQKHKGKIILLVNSYHEGYEWSDGIEKRAREVLDGTGVELRFFRMDTKRNNSVEFGKEAGLKAKAFVDELKPDVVIAADDNVQKYLVVPFLKDTSLPVVFCGVNWDASMYGFPCKNVTGMVEVDMIQELLELLRRYA